jgi:hypothetical protein
MKQTHVATTVVYSKDGSSKGAARSGSAYRCRMEGCTGQRLVVQWPCGQSTRPCTKGMFTRTDGALQIG